MNGRIAVAGLALESASFLPSVTELADFERQALRGPALLAGLRRTASVGGGFVDTLEAAGATILPLVYADAGAAGHASDAAFDAYAQEIVDGLAAARDGLAGVLLFLHGAMTTPRRADPELELLRRVRGAVGDGLPLMVALDLHGNLSPAMADLADGLFGYRYSPHTDMAETGARAARVLLRQLAGEVRPVTAIAKPPLVLPSIFTATALPPLRDLVASGLAVQRDTAGVLDLSIFCGFAYADVPQIGFSVTVVADGDANAGRVLAQRIADAMAERIWQARAALLHRELVYGLQDGVDRALALARDADRPVVLLEHADRMNDSTWVLRELVRRRVPRVAVPYLWDPAAAAAALAAGAGAAVTLRVGGHSSAKAGGPVPLTGKVLWAGDKSYTGTGPMRAGRSVALGPTAVVDAEGIVVWLTSESLSAIDTDPFVQFGMAPADFDLILLRSKTHFRAVYEPLAAAIVIVDTPDWGPADLTTLFYRKARPGVFPLSGTSG